MNAWKETLIALFFGIINRILSYPLVTAGHPPTSQLKNFWRLKSTVKDSRSAPWVVIIARKQKKTFVIKTTSHKTEAIHEKKTWCVYVSLEYMNFSIYLTLKCVDCCWAGYFVRFLYLMSANAVVHIFMKEFLYQSTELQQNILCAYMSAFNTVALRLYRIFCLFILPLIEDMVYFISRSTLLFSYIVWGWLIINYH